MASSKYWIKLYHDILDDPKMGTMSDRLWRRTIELFLVAGECAMGGHLPKTEELTYRLFRVDHDDQFMEDLAALEKKGIVTRENGVYRITKWEKRQGPMSSTERTRRYREAAKKSEYYYRNYSNDNDNGTNVGHDRDDAGTNPGTDRPTDKNRIDKKRIDKNINNPGTDRPTKNNGGKPKKDNDQFQNDIGDPFLDIWFKKTNIPVFPTQMPRWEKDKSEMIKNGVTPEIFGQAIEEQENSEYSMTNPSSVKNWAITLVKKEEKNIEERVYTHPNGQKLIVRVKK